jgi:hypothetical protein
MGWLGGTNEIGLYQNGRETPTRTLEIFWRAPKPSGYATAEQRRNDIYRNGAVLAPEVRNQQLTALQQEAVTRVTPLLGGDAGRFDAYKQYGGQWIQTLLPSPRPAP